MATISKVRRLVNPGRKRKLSPLQKLFFGSKRQRATVKANRSKRKRVTARKTVTRKRKRNVGSIITVWPKGKSNPGRKYKRRKKSNRGKRVIIVNKGERMATKRRRARRVIHRRRRRAVANPSVRRRRRRTVGVSRRRRTYSVRRRRNPGVKRYSRRRRSGVRRAGRRHVRRNPGMLTGTAGRVLGVVGGVAVTKLLCGFLPAQLSTGILGYASTAAIAVLQGKMVGKFSKSSALGNDMLIGGLAYLTAKVLNDFFPSIGSYTGISGMGLIGPSSFYTPQVNQMGNMGAFQVPNAIRGAIASSMPVASRGVGTMRRTGRL